MAGIEILGDVARMPFDIMRQGIGFGRQIVGGAVGLVMPDGDQRAFVQTRASEDVLERTKAAVEQIEGNESTDISTVIEDGYAKVGDCVLEAIKSPFVPAEKRNVVLGIADDIGLNPKRLGLSQEETTAIADKLETYRKVIVFRRRR